MVPKQTLSDPFHSLKKNPKSSHQQKDIKRIYLLESSKFVIPSLSIPSIIMFAFAIH